MERYNFPKVQTRISQHQRSKNSACIPHMAKLSFGSLYNACILKSWGEYFGVAYCVHPQQQSGQVPSFFLKALLRKLSNTPSSSQRMHKSISQYHQSPQHFMGCKTSYPCQDISRRIWGNLPDNAKVRLLITCDLRVLKIYCRFRRTSNLSKMVYKICSAVKRSTKVNKMLIWHRHLICGRFF